MVGIPKSTGCLICRKRKIKCDETWPACINCRKNGKLCPGPPARHTFKDSAHQLKSKNNTSEEKKPQNSLGPQSEHFTHLNAKRTEAGAIIHKFRLSQTQRRDELEKAKCHPRERLHNTTPPNVALPTLYKPPSPPPHYRLAQALVEAMEVGNTGYSISALGSFLREVPPRIGHNAALDAAVTFLVHAHSAMVHSRAKNLDTDPRYCLNAVRKLRVCLEDSKDGISSNTLCAALVLSLVEVLAGPQPNSSYLTHVGGVGRLLEILGPGKCRDTFAKQILHFARGGAIITSIYKQEECFVISPEWRDVAFDKTDASLDECLWIDVHHTMAELSILQKELDALNGSSASMTESAYDIAAEQALYEGYAPQGYPLELADPEITQSQFLGFDSELIQGQKFDFMYTHDRDPAPEYPFTHDLLQRLFDLRDALKAINVHLAAALADHAFAMEVPSLDPFNPLTTSYVFIHWRMACVYSTSWSFSILINKTILKLLAYFFSPFTLMPPSTLSRYALDAECRTLALDLCKMWESAWTNRPIGARHVWLGFVVAYEFCREDVQNWILGCLNKLLEEQGVKEWTWTAELIEMTCQKLMGEGDLTSKIVDA